MNNQQPTETHQYTSCRRAKSFFMNKKFIENLFKTTKTVIKSQLFCHYSARHLNNEPRRINFMCFFFGEFKVKNVIYHMCHTSYIHSEYQDTRFGLNYGVCWGEKQINFLYIKSKMLFD